MEALTRGPRSSARLLAYVLAWASCLQACAPWGQAHYRQLRRDVAAHQFDRGLTRIEAARSSLYGEKNELLYWLDRGVLAAAAGQYGLSTQAYEAAKGVQQKLYTQAITDHAAAFLLGERKLPYSAEPFEQVAWHLLEADNYLAQGAPLDAAVELRQMQKTLDRCHVAAGKSHSIYDDDAAGRWLAGLVREADTRELGHLSEARIDFERAAELYANVDAQHFATPVPNALRRALARVQAALQKTPQADPRAPLRQPVQPAGSASTFGGGTARAILLFYDGIAPHKAEAFWTAFLPVQVIQIAYPVFVPDRRPRLLAALVDQATNTLAPAELASNFAEKARVDLAERMEGIRGRAVARAVARATASEALMVGGAIGGGRGGAIAELVGLGLGITSAVTEHADVRSWQTLPARLSVAELELAAGPYDLAVVAHGQTTPLAHFVGQVAAGDTLFLSARAY